MVVARITGVGLVWVVGAMSAFVCAPGCAKKNAHPWTPKPLVHWEDITTRPVEKPEHGYRILLDQPSKGLFPADIAVTRVSVEDTDDAAEARRPSLYPEPRNEYLQWNAAFDDLMAISEVFPIAQCDMGGADAEPEQIVAAFRALRARMGIIYALNELAEDEAEMIGALYDTSRDHPIASFHARAFSIEVPEDERDEDPASLWQTDARALVRKAFEGITYACLRELILRDEPAAIEEPTGWAPPRPPRPVEWPPRSVPSSP